MIKHGSITATNGIRLSVAGRTAVRPVRKVIATVTGVVVPVAVPAAGLTQGTRMFTSIYHYRRPLRRVNPTP
jgi:hypothetical protein